MNLISFLLVYSLERMQVGKETIHSSDDAILKQDMPASLHRVEGASRLLEEASSMLKADPYSVPARYTIQFNTKFKKKGEETKT